MNSVNKRKLSCCNFETSLIKNKKVKFSTDINDLPDDLLYLIFSHLSAIELLLTIYNVSLRFRRIIQHPSFWRVITISNSEKQEEAINLLKYSSKMVNELHIYERVDTNVILNEVAKHNQNVTILSLTKCNGNSHASSINSSVIIRVLRRLVFLNHLRLYDTKLKSVKFFEILGSQKFINLRTKKNKCRPKNPSIAYVGALTYKQLIAFITNNTTGKVKLQNGRIYSTSRILEILNNIPYDVNSVVTTFDNIIS